MKKFLIFALSFIAISFTAFGQNMADVIKMKNGQTYHGKIIGQKSDNSIECKLFDGTIISLQKDNIESITEEQTHQTFAKSEYMNTKTRYSIGMDSDYKKKGYFGMVQLGSIVNTNISSRIGAEINIINGYRVVPQFCVGAGIGLGMYHLKYTDSSSMCVPVFLHLRSDFLKRRFTPFIAFNIGYNIPVLKQSDSLYESGFTCEPQIGVGFKFLERYQLNLTFGYSINNSKYYSDYYGETYVSGRLQAFTVKIGFIW